VRAIQESVTRLVPDQSCASRGESIEPAAFLKRGYGCCYDRARFFEKALRSFGLKTRRVAMFDTNTYSLAAFFLPNIESHAATEVLTERGWMGIDMKHSFILIDEQNQPTTYQSMISQLDEFDDVIESHWFYELRPAVIYGLYSRHVFSMDLICRGLS